MDDDDQTIRELLDDLDPGRTPDGTRRRVQAARQEIREAVGALTELLDKYPDEATAWTLDELAEALRAMKLYGECLTEQADEAAVALDNLRAIQRESD